MLWSSTKIQLKVMRKRKEFIYALLAMTGYACAAFLYVLVKCRGMDVSVMKDANQNVCYSPMNGMWNFFSILYPFLVVIPFATSYIDDYRNRLLAIYFSRSSRQVYYFSKVLAAWIGTALVIAIPCTLNLALCNIFLPHNHNTWLGEYQLENFYRAVTGTNHLYETNDRGIFLIRLFLRSPLLYNIVYLFIFSLFSGLLGAFVLSLSFWIRKKKMVLFLPVFIIMYALDTINIKWLYMAIDGKKPYMDTAVLDYVTPSFSSGGMNPAFIGIVIMMLSGFIILSTVHAIGEDLAGIQS